MGGNSDGASQAGSGGTSAACQAVTVTNWTKDFGDLIVDTDIAATYQAKLRKHAGDRRFRRREGV